MEKHQVFSPGIRFSVLERGQQADPDAVLRDIVARDRQDESRPVAPLRRAEGAALLDTTQLDLDQSLERLLTLIKEKLEP